MIHNCIVIEKEFNKSHREILKMPASRFRLYEEALKRMNEQSQQNSKEHTLNGR
jgi:hypothetical protein